MEEQIVELKGKRIAMLAEDNYEDPELWYPLYRMREAGAEVLVVGMPGIEAYHSKHGYPVGVDVAAGDVGLPILTGSSFRAVMRRTGCAATCPCSSWYGGSLKRAGWWP